MKTSGQKYELTKLCRLAPHSSDVRPSVNPSSFFQPDIRRYFRFRPWDEGDGILRAGSPAHPATEATLRRDVNLAQC